MIYALEEHHDALSAPIYSLAKMEQTPLRCTIGSYFLDHALAAFRLGGAADTQAERDAKYILKRIDSTGQPEISRRENFGPLNMGKVFRTGYTIRWLSRMADPGKA